jgi:hypothetical protein
LAASKNAIAEDDRSHLLALARQAEVADETA